MQESQATAEAEGSRPHRVLRLMEAGHARRLVFEAEGVGWRGNGSFGSVWDERWEERSLGAIFRGRIFSNRTIITKKKGGESRNKVDRSRRAPSRME